jgi:cytochrome c heme-lyase
MMPTNLHDLKFEDQKIPLSQQRTSSTIPKADGNATWEYPSPQQFYNALRRKGWSTPEEHIDVMVDIHNYLNEACWKQVLEWESRHQDSCSQMPILTKFKGRPSELSPKAWLVHWFRGTPRPFDRHDWTINRCGREVRYVIDYYGADEESVYADVRPALDSIGAVVDRIQVAFDRWRNKETVR